MNRTRFLWVMIFSLILGFAGLNMASRILLDGARIDLTERGLYQLSEGTQDVLDRLDEPMSLDFYYSRADAAGYPEVRAYGARVRELLRTLAARSGGALRLEEIDPAPFSPEEDAAIASGLQPVPVEGGGQIFFGLVGRNAVDDARIIAFFDPQDEARLEYEIVRLIAELERARTPHLAIISDLPFAPDREGRSGNRIIDELGATYQLSWLEPDFDAIPDDADAVLVIHPPLMSETQLYLLDQFILARGRALVAVDPMAHLALKPGPDGLPPLNAQRATDLGRLFASWGVLYDRNAVAMDAETGLPVQIIEGGRTRMRAYPLWFSVPPSGLNQTLPSLAGLSRSVNLGAPGVLGFDGESGLSVTPLLSTSVQAARLDADIAASSPSPEELMRGFEADPDAPLSLGLLLNGVLPSAFADGPPAEDGAPLNRTHLDESTGPGEVIVLADVDLFDPAFFLRADPVQGEQVVADNLALVLNLVDRLAGDRALVSLRSRSSSNRPMTRVDDLRTRAEARYLTLQDTLQAELNEAEGRLDELTRLGRASALGGAGSDDAAEADALRLQILDARERLREIERGFRVEIDALENRLLLWTLWLPPLVVLAFGVSAALVRRRRRA
ncbi:GldG family protein [Oceanicaulis alexandrii]|uniref:GldG family protein n=1 Tax=Oceanicaulis alexandrii TaxID=153233 RepID=UPI002356E548|nr:GldG family protein [Oceanicaulis alexandrii]